MEVVPLRGMVVAAVALASASGIRTPAPGDPPCLDAARALAARMYAVQFERLVPAPHSPDPDDMMFPSEGGMELAIDVAPDHGQAGADMILIDEDDRAHGGWLRQAYMEHGFTLDTRELAIGGVVVKIDLTATREDPRREPVASLLEQATSRCAASR